MKWFKKGKLLKNDTRCFLNPIFSGERQWALQAAEFRSFRIFIHGNLTFILYLVNFEGILLDNYFYNNIWPQHTATWFGQHIFRGHPLTMSSQNRRFLTPSPLLRRHILWTAPYLKRSVFPLTQKLWSYPLFSPPGQFGSISDNFLGILKSKTVPPTSAKFPRGICLSLVGR